MIQDILVWLILAATATYTVIATIKSLKKRSTSACGDGCCSCDAKKEILRQIEYKKMKLVDRD